MGLGKIFKSMLGGESQSDKPASEPVSYKGLTIEAEPIKEGDQYRTAGYISGEVNGEARRTRFIRADNHGSREAAVDHSIAKARQVIDEQGESVLSREMA